MPRDREPVKIEVYGRSGSGKSHLVKTMLKREPRVVVFDPLDEYRAAGFARTERRTGLVTAIKRRWKAGRWRIAYVPPAGEGRPVALHELCKPLLQRCRSPSRWRRISHG